MASDGTNDASVVRKNDASVFRKNEAFNQVTDGTTSADSVGAAAIVGASSVLSSREASV